jgi:hypothetical protein
MTFTRALTPWQTAQVATLVANGKTRAEVAEKFGVSRRTISRILNTDPDEKKPPRPLKPCGTNAAYQRHRRRGERCWKCSEAHSKDVMRWKKKQDRPIRPRKTEEAA